MCSPGIEIDDNYTHVRLLAEILGVVHVTSLKRVLSGQINSVYFLNEEFVLRFSDGLQDGRLFEKEARILSAISRRVLVPELAYVDSSRTNFPFDIIVSRMLNASTLAVQWALSPDLQRRKYVHQLSSELSRLHRLPLRDFPFLMEDPTPWHIRFQDYVEALFLQARSDNDIDDDCINLLQEYFYTHRHKLSEPFREVLVHGDIHFENILADGDRVIALIDFEYADIAPLDFELAKIINFCLFPQKFVESSLEDWYKENDLTVLLAWIKEDYKALFDCKFSLERQRIYLIPDTLWGFKWARIQKRKTVLRHTGTALEYEINLARNRFNDIYLTQKIEAMLS